MTLPMPGPAPLSYDRRVPEGFLAHFDGGALGVVADCSRLPKTRPLVDLQFRGRPDLRRWATLYVGLTKVLDVDYHLTTGKLRLCAEGWPVEHGFDPAWSEWKTPGQVAALGLQLEHYLAAAILEAPSHTTKEGLVQAQLASGQATGFRIIDREIEFGSPKQARAVVASFRSALEPAFTQALPPAPWVAGNAKSAHQKIDALAVDEAGRLLVIEVKHGEDTTKIGWTPLQVAAYLHLIRRWIADVGEQNARTTLEGTLNQRVQLGLVPKVGAQLTTPLIVVPVIAIGLPIKNQVEALGRLESVRVAVASGGELLDGLELWSVDSDGSIATDLGQA